MKYKVTINDKKYIITAKDLGTVIDVINELEDERLSPMTYKKLKELGYSSDDWKDWDQQHANEVVAKGRKTEPTNESKKQEKTSETHNQSQTAKTSSSRPRTKFDTENAKRMASEYDKLKNNPETAKLIKEIESSKSKVEIEKLMSHPAVKQMDKLIDDYAKSVESRIARDGYVISPEEREYIKSELMKRGSVSGVDEKGDAIYNGPLKKERKAVIAIGLPAAGKSTQIVNKVSGPMGAYVIDSDEAKFLSSEFRESNGLAADVIHSESQGIIKDIFAEQLKLGTNMVIPVIGSDKSKLQQKWIKQLEDAGYDVEIQYQPANPQESVNRVVKRAVSKNRPIRSSIIFGYGDKPAGVYESFKDETNKQGNSYVRHTDSEKTDI